MIHRHHNPVRYAQQAEKPSTDVKAVNSLPASMILVRVTELFVCPRKYQVYKYKRAAAPCRRLVAMTRYEDILMITNV
jgi:hypothetical protein